VGPDRDGASSGAADAPSGPRVTRLVEDASPDPGAPTAIGPDVIGDVSDLGPLASDPSASPSDGFDRVRLASGEWLVGRVLRLRDGTLEFDSEGLGTVKLAFGDIVELRTAEAETVLLEDGGSRTGRIVLDENGLRIRRAGATRGEPIAREDVLAVMPGRGAERDAWSGKFTLGFAGRSGNTDQIDATTNIVLRRETVRSRWDTTFNGAYSEVQGVEATDNQRLDTRLDLLASRRLFVTPIGVTVLRDPFQNLRFRVTPFAALGYDLVEEDSFSWTASAGPAIQFTRFETPQAAQDDTDTTAAFRASTDIDWQITPDVEASLVYAITGPLPDVAMYNHRLTAGLSLDLIGDFDLDVQFVWDRVNEPTADEFGVVPEPDDFRLSVGLGWQF
jgi:putative salt-induced outer membrane protein YdiY